jgi:hypothetical protein
MKIMKNDRAGLVVNVGFILEICLTSFLLEEEAKRIDEFFSKQCLCSYLQSQIVIIDRMTIRLDILSIQSKVYPLIYSLK